MFSRLRRSIAGVAALLGVAFILVGWPWLLLTAASGPLRDYLPDLGDPALALLRPDAGGLLLGLVLVIAIAAWGVTALALVVEVVSQARGLRAPKLGAMVPQASMSRLATAVLFLLPLGGHLAGSPVAAAQPTAHPAVPAVARVASQPASAPSASTAPASGGRATAERASRDCPEPLTSATYTVHPGDTLWDISERKLGAGQRYPEIFRASREIRQPDGQRLRDPGIIQPGWRLSIPAIRARGGAAPCPAEVAQPAPAIDRGGATAAVDHAASDHAASDHAASDHAASDQAAADHGSATATSTTATPTSGSQSPRVPDLDRSPTGLPATPTTSGAAGPRPTTPAPTATTDAVRPAPSGLAASREPGHATLTWQPVVGATGYWVQVAGQSMKVPGTTIVLRGLDPGSEYMVTVRAMFAADWGAPAQVRVQPASGSGRATPSGTSRSARRAADPAALLALRRPGTSASDLLARVAREAGIEPARLSPAGSATDRPASTAAIDCRKRMVRATGLRVHPLPPSPAVDGPEGRAASRGSRLARAGLSAGALRLSRLAPRGVDPDELLAAAGELSLGWSRGSAAQVMIATGVGHVRA